MIPPHQYIYKTKVEPVLVRSQERPAEGHNQVLGIEVPAARLCAPTERVAPERLQGERVTWAVGLWSLAVG